MTDCIFCSIIAGEIPSTRVYEDDTCVAFLDINPVVPGHTLVVPKVHSPSFIETESEAVSGLGPVLQRVASACVKGIGAQGCTISTNNGAAAGQTVLHVHWHIIPRRTGDGLKLWPQKTYAQGEQEKVAASIRAAF